MGNKKKELTKSQRFALFAVLSTQQQENNNGHLKRGSASQQAKKFDCDRKTVSRFWRQMMERVRAHNLTCDEAITQGPDFFASNCVNRGRPLKWNQEEVSAQVEELALRDRITYENLSKKIGIPRTTLQLMLRKGEFKRHTSSLKPTLTEDQKIARVMYCLDEIYPRPHQDGSFHYKNMYDRVDIDETWFHMTQDGQRYILTKNEVLPYRHTRHKGYINKVLFLCAQARPRWDPHRNAMWNGKLGLFPVGAWEPAQRTSINREAGAMVWNNESVTRDVYRKLLLEKVIPSIIEKWPRNEWNNNRVIIRLQQDGPNSHITPDDTEFTAGLHELQVENKIILYTQPSNSPDLNINDLGFFRALKAAYCRKCPTTEQEIIQFAKETYEEYSTQKINFIWLSLMNVMNVIIECHGENEFELPHMGKEKLVRRNALPETIQVTDVALPLLGLTA